MLSRGLSGSLITSVETHSLERSMKKIQLRDVSFWERNFVSQKPTFRLYNRAGNVHNSRALSEPTALGCPPSVQQSGH